MTLNQVISILKQYFNNHPMIEDVTVSLGDDDLNALNNLKYRIVDIQYLDTDVVDKRFQHNFKIIIGDLTNPNVKGIDFEIFSDCLQISGDFFQWMDDNYDFDWIKTTNVQPFTDSNVDRVSGVVFTLGVYTWIQGNIDCIDTSPTPPIPPVITPDNFCFQFSIDNILTKQHTLQKGPIPAEFQTGYQPSDIRDYWEAMDVDGLVRLFWSDSQEWTISIGGQNWYTSQEDVVSPDFVAFWQTNPVVSGGSSFILSGSECVLPNDMCFSLQVPVSGSWQATLSRGIIPADFQSAYQPENIRLYWEGQTEDNGVVGIYWIKESEEETPYWRIVESFVYEEGTLRYRTLYYSYADVVSPLSIQNWLPSNNINEGTTFLLRSGGC